jgi:hypothetical protein
VVAPGKYALRRLDHGAAADGERNEGNLQQSVAGLPFRKGIRTGLFSEHFTEKSEEQTEGIAIEFAEIRKACGLTGGEARTRRLDLQRLLSEFIGQTCAGFGTITYAGQWSARRGLAVFAQPGMNREGWRVGPARRGG